MISVVKPPRWHHSRSQTLGALLLACLLLAWGRLAKDPDFWLPDFFSGFILFTAAVFIVSGFLPSRAVRLFVLSLFVFIPPPAILALEIYYRYRDIHCVDSIESSEDPLLRYRYRPASQANGADAPGAAKRVNNSRGLNDAEYAIPKPKGVFRIIVLGDSVPNDGSLRHDETFPKRLEAALNADPMVAADGKTRYRRAEVINVSCEGYNSIQEVRLLEKAALDYAPDLVIVAYVLNDPFLQNGIYRRLGNSFFLFRMFNLWEYYLNGAFGNPSAFGIADLHHGYNYALVVTNSFERLKLLSILHHFKVAVAVLPVMISFDRHPFIPIYEKVAQTARDQGFDPIIMFERFRAYPLPTLSKKADIFHPNAAGHALMADILRDYILSHHLTPVQNQSRGR